MNDVDPAEAPDPVMLALREYQAAVDAGTRPDRRQFLDRYPVIAAELAECLDGMDFLRAAAPGLSTAGGMRPPATSPAEGTLGDFRLLRELGRGGMGIVYEAEQISLGRRVALKVLPLAATLDARQLRRFENEARAAAGLHHTHIVPVYAVGQERSVPYYAMQLIDGRSLAEVIDDLRGTPRPARPGAETAVGAASVTRQPSDSPAFFRTVATLGVQAAEALEYAHQMGVVHRDVKPSNLILDGRDHLWVTDFGLARIQAAPGVTAPGDVVGTLRYMSPEQAAGDPAVDPRSDVYSLGATLYELLTLHSAFPGNDPRECLRQVLEDDPAPLRSWNRAVPAELETIVLKALARAPADRYGSARELADDLRRFLDDRPVVARRPSLLDRGRKWGRRHPGVIWGALLLLVLLAAGLGAFSVFAAREQARTQAALERERERAAEAEERFELAREAADALIRASEEELADRPFLEGPRQRLLEAALVYYQKFIEQRQDDPEAQAELVATQERIKKVLADLAVLRAAGDLFHLARQSVANDLGLTPEQRARLDVLFARQGARWARLLRNQDRLSPQDRRQKLLDLPRISDAEARRILEPGQLQRLRQVAIQLQGTSAFRDQEVVTALGLTADQRARARAIEDELFLAGRPARPGAAPGDVRRAWDSKVNAAIERILASLTPEQVKRWKELTGEPFAGSRLVPFQGVPGGRPGQRRPPPRDAETR